MSTAPVVKIAGTGAAAATFTTASYTPGANSRELAFISGFKSTASPALPSISDTAGNTWTLLADFETTTFANPAIRSAWYISDDTGSSPASRTVTVAATGGNSLGVIIADVLSVDTDGTLAQAAATGEDLVNGDPSCTFGSSPGATNITLLGASFGGGNVATKPASFTSLASASHSTARWNAASYDITSAAQGPNAYSSNNFRSIIIGIELAPASSGAVTVNVTGNSSTASVGDVSVTGIASVSPTGNAATASVGNVVVSLPVVVSPTGNASTASVGTVVATGTAVVSPTGNAATASVGNVVVSLPTVVSVTGNSATASVGTVTVSGKANVSPTGNAVTASVGTVTASGAANVAVTGNASTASVGTVTVSISGGTNVNVNVTGNAATASVGDVTVSGKANVSVTGQSATVSVGSVSVTAVQNVSVSVTGNSATSAVGTATVTVATGVNVNVTGQAATSAVGTVTVDIKNVTVSPVGFGLTCRAGRVVGWVDVNDASANIWNPL